MTLLDASSAVYALHVRLRDGRDAIVPHTGLAWEELAGEVATRITATFPDDTTEEGVVLAEEVTLGTQITVLAALGESSDLEEVARGVVEEVQPNDGTGATFQIIAYDPVRALLADKESYYYPADQPASARIRDLCQRHGITPGQIDSSLDGANLPAKTVTGQTLADVLLATVQEAHEVGAPRVVIRSTRGQLEVVQPGGNQTVYWLKQGESVLRVPERLSTVDFISRVEVRGRAENGQAAPVIATLEGAVTTYGSRTDIITLASTKTPQQIELSARLVLDEKGRPRHDRSIEAFDAPAVRKFDRVRVSAGSLDGYFSVESVTHDEQTGIMRLSLGNLQEQPVEGVFSMQAATAAEPVFQVLSKDRVTPAERYALAIQCGGLTPDQAVIAVAISMAEDFPGDPAAEHQNPGPPPSIDVGLWQINWPRWKQYGDRDQLKDPCTNAKAMGGIFRSGGWNQWCTYEPTACNGKGNSAYRKHLDAARQGQADYNAGGVGVPTATVQRTVPSAGASGGVVEPEKLMATLQPWMGTPYHWGGNTRSGVDCSGLVVQVYGQLGVDISHWRTTTTMWAAFTPISDPQVGDLVFFNDTCTNCGGNPTHVGIIVGPGQMVDARTGGVTRDDLTTSYWRGHLAGYRRIPR